MGGAIVLHWAANGPSQLRSHIRGYAVEAPFIATSPATKPWNITVKLGRLAGKVMPHKHFANKIPPPLLSRDLEVQKEYEDDELCHDTGTLEGLAGMLDRSADLENGSVTVGEGKGEGGITRIWVSHGTEDGVCSHEATKWWFDLERIKDKTFKSYEGLYHKLHREPGEDKFTFANDLADWILLKSEGKLESKL